jgi:hypothetical protein
MKLMSSALILTAALASGSACAHGGSSSHGGGGSRAGGGFHGSAGFHGGAGGFHRGFHHFHDDRFHGNFGVFVGVPYFWPWYSPPTYYYPPAYPYEDPPVYSYDPPSVAPSSPSYAPPAAEPGSLDNPVVELPPSNSPKASPGNPLAHVLPRQQLLMYPRQGQSAQQQTSDRDQCNRWAMDQIGSAQVRLSPAQTSDYYRAMEACLDARGYSVR